MIVLFATILIQYANPARTVQAPTYEEQIRTCEAALKQEQMGTVGYDGVLQHCRLRETEALRRETGNLIVRGRCNDAIALSLRAGDLQLATQLRSYCASPR